MEPRADAESMRGVALMACSIGFLTEPRTTCPGMAPPTVGWALSNQSLIKKKPYRLAYTQILWRHFSNEVLITTVTLDCQLDITLASQHNGLPL